MKAKILCLLLAALFVFSLTACGDTSKDTTKDIVKKDGEVVASGKKYAYKDNDILLLNVENQTEKGYNVTAVVHYFDAEGNELKSQKQTFNGWSSGYQNHFLFQPNITFDTFTYELELEEVKEEECYSKYIVTEFVGLREMKARPSELSSKGDLTKYPVIISESKVENIGTSMLDSWGYYCVMDKNGNVYAISSFTVYNYSPQKEDFCQSQVYWEKTTEKLVWPDELTDGVTAIFAVITVKVSE